MKNDVNTTEPLFSLTRLARGVGLTALALFSFSSLAYAEEAEFYLTPETGVYTIGEEFPIAIKIDTKGSAINAAEGSISFANDELEVVNIDTGGTIFSSWTIKPGYSNEEGTIYFGGVTPAATPFAGDDGLILTATFRALRDIASQVRFSQGAAILAADGKGTNILTAMNAGVYTLNAEEIVPNIEYVTEDNTPVEGIISSPTHPDPTRWYATTTANFVWDVADDITALRLLVDDEPKSVPTVYYDDPIREKTITDLEEGVSYFHLQMRNSSGWGDVAHFPVRVDFTPPSTLTVNRIGAEDPTDPRLKLAIMSEDALSGIERFEVAVNDEDPLLWVDEGSGTYVHSTPLSPGLHQVTVTATDFAGNALSEIISIEVDALPPPVITDMPQELAQGETLEVRGSAAPNAEVDLWVQKNNSAPIRQVVGANSQGVFSHTIPGEVEQGVYQVWAESRDARGAESEASERRSVIVYASGMVMFGERAISFMTIMVPLAALAVLLVIILAFGWYRLKRYTQAVDKEVAEAEVVLQQAFDHIRRDMEEGVTLLETAQTSRKLSFEEKSVLQRLRRHLGADIEEEKVEKEIHDIRLVANRNTSERPKKLVIENIN
jgi:hypothetical protein